MLSEKEVRKLLIKAQQGKSVAKAQGTDESYRIWCKVEKFIKKILER